MVVSSAAFIKYIRQFHEFGPVTACQVEDGIPYYINAFWTSKQRQGHTLHQISYRACFKGELPGFFIQHLTQKGGYVYDPFMGRGTTLVQAALMGRNVVGNDINPLSRYLVQPRLAPISVGEVQKVLAEIPLTHAGEYPAQLRVFFHEQTLKDIVALRDEIFMRMKKANGRERQILGWIFMVALNRLTGHSPGFFSVRTMPPNQTVSLQKQRALNAKHHLTPPQRDVKDIILKKTRSLLRRGCVPDHVHYELGNDKAWDTPWIDTQSVDLVVTSPPFLDVVDYKRDNWLRCWFARIDPSQLAIDTPGNITQWTHMMYLTLQELARVLKIGGWIVFEVGEVRKGKILLERYIWEAAGSIPSLERVGVMINQQNFTKTSNCWGISNQVKGTNTNRLVLLRKCVASSG